MLNQMKDTQSRNSQLIGQNSRLKTYNLIEIKKILTNEFTDSKLINMAIFKLSKNTIIT